jgi:acetyl-CoA carboxylase carboxyl transferase subunit alpha
MDDMILDFEKPVAELESRIRDLVTKQSSGEANVADEIKTLQAQCDRLKQKVYTNLTPWQRVQLARHPKRPYLKDYIPRIFTDFMELHGDRCYGDDAALLGGMAFLDKTPVMVLGHQKGRTLQESMAQNFGMPHPEGYRKALRLMQLAERFNMPVLTFVDTAGAYPGIGAEERGQAEAIARNLRDMAALKVPVIVTVLGEGGSGGALAIGIGDAVLMLENAWYSVISPEGCASILFRDASKAAMAAEALKLTAPDLVNFGVIDEIVPEPLGGAQRDPDAVAESLKEALISRLKTLMETPVDKLLRNRFEKFRGIGQWQEKKPTSSSRQAKKKKA